ncbi:MAG: 16S rRNA (adenine(1518)-N(6)/adenine(1519)-N(6))-dimethyltransferase RsmA [Bacteroidota bacterium]|nr:16S rRNA (adenine(1518)-N(6)/adenine(1519)-N(6))-dimethyltransferase RsmA [Bacteroidota bacterium]
MAQVSFSKINDQLNKLISNKDKYNLYKPKKFLGQNFLVDENIAKKIAASLEIKPDDTVIEIGPGQGVLSKYLCKLSQKFFAVEIDKFIFEKLNQQFGEQIKLIHKDFLKFDFNTDISDHNGKIKIIGNIPYNITTEILFKLYDSNFIIESAVLMMQKEVAMRLTAKPNTKDYGILAIQTQLHTVPKILFNVPPTAFFPKPNVNSSIVKLEFKKDTNELEDKALFKKLVRESFGQRRKTMRNSLKKFAEKNKISFDEINFDFSRRPENVSLKEFVILTNGIKKLLEGNTYG